MIRLDKYIKQVRGISYSPSDISEVPLEDYLPILKANNIQENTLDTSNLIYIHKSKIKNEQLIRKGDLLLAASSGSKDIVGKNVFFEEDFNGSFGAFCKVVRPLENIYPKFLSAFFKTPIYKRHIRNLIQGANINNLRNEDIDSLKIPEFTQQDQIIIATILSKAETLIKQRKESIKLLDAFLKSTFLEMFGDPVRNERAWKVQQVSKFSSSRLGKMLDEKKIVGNNLKPYLRNSNVQWFKFKLDDLLEMDFDEKDRVEYSLERGDILMCEGGGIGRCAIWKNELQECYFQKALHRIRLDKKNVLPEYFVFMFWLYHLHGGLQKYTGAATISHLTGEKLKKMWLPIPPINNQKQFVQIVEKTEILKIKYQQSLQELENLYASLSQLAFKGRLDLSEISLSPFEVDGNPWPEPGGKGYGDPFESVEGLPDDGRMFGAEEFKKLMDTGKWEDVTNTNLDEIETSSAHQPMARRKVASELERNISIDIQSEELARFIQNKFYSAHFNSEMLLEMLKTHGRAVHYFTSEELKFENKTEGRLDLKKFIFDCLRGVNPHLRLEQFFHNAFERRTELVIVSQFGQKYVEMDSAEKTGIYFKILS